MTLVPFIGLLIGGLIGWKKSGEHFLKQVDIVTSVVLVLLMLTIGANIGANDSVMLKLDKIGLHCAVIALCAVFFSILGVVLLERTILPLDELQKQISLGDICLAAEEGAAGEKEKPASALVWTMPVSIIAGIILGFRFFTGADTGFLDHMLIGILILLYIGVGINIGSNREVYHYIKLVGFRVVYISIAILAGSLMGGFAAGMTLGVPLEAAVISASGMSYYSLTGAYMTEVYGIETGTYGFIVNVMREFLTIVTLPLLIKISKGSPIASGGAGNMDTTLMPITKFVGAELGLITFITGTILTLAVPFILPILHSIL
ncbi:lysine exporter LysO family protein [Acetonema longum]|uniref:Lysine exporter LysO family protein n=1 Tax=Acetonema longum DSM 6540 TaxID=1009370 RepID=F7NFJ3_9FIRM|nr:lysine exporter LysO family protein [Acetonema longum]EGO65192.1 hypothetical protein ALO_04101 [Acetonema longum DSM 6540]